MANYHINPETFEVGICKATIKCDFAKNGEEVKHYASEQEAYQNLSEYFANKYGTFETHRQDALREKRTSENRKIVFFSKNVHTEDAEDIRKLPIYLFDYDTVTSTLITRVDRSKDGTVIEFYDNENNLVLRADAFDNVSVSEFSVDEIIKMEKEKKKK